MKYLPDMNYLNIFIYIIELNRLKNGSIVLLKFKNYFRNNLILETLFLNINYFN